MEFNKGTFVYIAFFLGPDECLPDCEDLSFADVEWKGARFERGRFNSETSKADLIRQFGAPTVEDTDDSELLMIYERGAATMEFELNLEDRLKRWNIFPTDEN